MASSRRDLTERRDTMNERLATASHRYNDSTERSSRTHLKRGEKNYFPNGVMRSLNLHTPSVLRRPNFSQNLESLPRRTQYAEEYGRLDMARRNGGFRDDGAIRPMNGFPLYQASFNKLCGRVPATAGASSTKTTSLGPVVPRRGKEGNISFSFNAERLLDEDIYKKLGVQVPRETRAIPRAIGRIERKEHKGATRAISEEKREPTKEPGMSESCHSNSNLVTANLEIEDGNQRESFDTERRKVHSRSSVSEDTSVSIQTSSSWQTMSNRSTPCKENTVSENYEFENRTDVTDGPGDQNNENRDEIRQTSFQVFVRIRPLDDTAPDASSTRLRSLSVENDRQVLLCTRPSKGKESNGTKHLFSFARVLPESSPQRDVFEVTTQSLVEAVIAGHQGCVITYGIPNTGKSYTLYGKATSGKHRGIITRAMETMLGIVNADKSPEVKYQISTSFLQIYNEKFYDLLDPSASGGIKILENGTNIKIEGATQLNVTNVDEISKQLRRSPNRMRDAGSRSHTVFTVRVVKEELLTLPSNGSLGDDNKENVKITEGELKFVDLVGVERSVKHITYDSPAVGTAEAKTAKSLQLFANALLSLANDKNAVVPYRDSKLTRLLRNALGGDCMTRLIVATSPCPSLAHETLSCLQFAQKACQIVNCPFVKVNIKERCKQQEHTEGAEEVKDPTEQHPSKSSTPTGYKLPPIHSNSGHRLSVSGEDSANPNKEGSVPTQNQRRNSSSPKIDEVNDIHTLMTSSSSGVYSSSSTEERAKLSPDIHLNPQFKSTEAENKVVYLPLLSSGTGVAGLLARQTSPTSTTKRLEASRGQSSRSPTDGSNRRSRRWQKTSERSSRNSPGQNTPSTDYASTIHPAPEYIINGDDSLHSHGSTMTSRLGTPAFTADEIQGRAVEVEDRACCAACKAREEKIKGDYDRMILFSKKDRDDKQLKLVELQQEIKKLKSESVSLTQIRQQEEERMQEKTAKEIQTREIVRLETLVETLKVKLTGMVSSIEVTALQELRRKEHKTTEDLKREIENLKLKLKEEAEKSKRELATRNDAMKKSEREIINLKRETMDKEKALQDYKRHQEEKTANVSVEIQRIQSRHDTIVGELNAKLLTSAKEITRMRETETKMMKQRQEEKENLERELTLAKQTAAHTQAELKIAQGKLVSFEREQRVARSANYSSGIASMASRASLRRSTDYRNTGTAMSDSPDFERDGACVTCGKHIDRFDISSDISRDEELRILLLQDAKNREILIQLKRERNLLCDVMKIMYCRQWFQDEAIPHIKRTLRRVGVDTKSLNLYKKKY